jgi:hypothetical protein
VEIQVCPSCGAVLKAKNKGCLNCGTAQSKFAATQVATLAQPAPPMIVSVAPDRLILERIVANRQLVALVPENSHPYIENRQSDQPPAQEVDGGLASSFSYASPISDNLQTVLPDNNDARETSQATAPTNNYQQQSSTGSFPLEGAGFFGGQDLSGPHTPQTVAATQEESAPWDQDLEDEQIAVAAEQAPQSAVSISLSEGTQLTGNSAQATISSAPSTPPAPTLSASPAQVEPPAPAQAPAPSISLQSAIQGSAQPAPALAKSTATSDFFTATAAPSPATSTFSEPPLEESRPHVAGPDFFSGKNKASNNYDEDAPTKKISPAKAAQAFDFFADGPGGRSEKSEPVMARASGSQEDEAHTSFEDLLKRNTKSNPSAQSQESSATDFRKSAPTNTLAKPGFYDSASDDEEEDDEEVDDIDEDEEENDEPPTRRSFSGGTATATVRSSQKNSPKNLKAKASSGKNKLKSGGRKQNDDEDENNDEEDNEDSNGKKKASGKLRSMSSGGLFNLGGFPIGPKLIGISACIIGMLFFAISHVIGNLSASGLPNASAGLKMPNLPSVPSMPKVAGLWSIKIIKDKKAMIGVMELHQQGFGLYGRGRDSMGNFSINGNLSLPNKIQLKKQYLDPNGRNNGSPIFYEGAIDFEGVPLKAMGVWQFSQKKGSNFSYLNKARTINVTGRWIAQLTKALPPDSVTIASDPSKVFGGSGNSATDKPFNFIDFFSKNGIFVALGGGIFAVSAVFSLFGPNGLINIWNKQKYIPSQFKGQHDKIKSQLAKPIKKGSLPLGQRVEWKPWLPLPWIPKDLAIPPDLRKANPHLLILGQGGKGKTRLIAHMLMQDILGDERAVVAIDSDGSLVDLITTTIAAHPKANELAKRVILIDPTYKGNKTAYNPLELLKEGDIQTAAASIVYGFKAIYTEVPGSQSQWNAQTADILRNAVLLLMANGKTLTDLPSLLNDNDFRDILLENVERKKDDRQEFSTLLDQWGRYKKLARTDQWITWVEPILNRINPMLSNPRIRNILTKPDGDLKLIDVITKKKILLVKIPQGEFGQDANLLGSLIVAGVKQSALTLSSSSAKNQQNVSLYLDNFDNFIEQETLENITSETKKFKIGFIGVTKSLQHLPEDFRNNLIINIGTLITFALAKKDGDLLGPQMFPIDGRKVKHQTMSNLFNPINSSPQFELVSDEEKLNIDKIVRQEERTFFCYRMGAEAGLFNLKSHDFNEVPENKINHKLIEKMHTQSSKKADKQQA